MVIVAKELVPIPLSYLVWGPLLSGIRVEFRCNNLSVVDSVNNSSSREPTVMHLLCCLWFFAAYFDIKITASGILNTAADKLSKTNQRSSYNQTPYL